MTSLNSFLLYIFAKNIRLGSDVQSFLKRYQILSIVYVHFLFLLIVLSWEFIAGFLLGYPDAGFFSPISLVFASLSAFFLQKGRIDDAAGVMIPYMHCLNFAAGSYAKRPMIALYALMLCPHFTFFISSSVRVRNLNFGLCAIQIVHHTYKIKQMFEFGLSEEQNIQINSFLIVSYVIIGSICLGCAVEKSVEKSLWRMAQTNQENSEKLTQEVVQAAAAKDAFVSSLSHEIRNPLNSLTTSIDFLLETVKDSESIHILKNAKLSGEVLLNLVNNVLDVAKLRSEKMEIASVEVNFESIIEKTFVINSENLKKTGVTAKAEIDKKLPKNLWIDPSRILQILMNLMSNALKFTPKGGNVNILVKWCPISSTRENLLKPIHIDHFKEKVHNRSFPEYKTANHDIYLERINSDLFNEFSKEEEVQRQKNLNCITKEFQVRGLEGLINANHICSHKEPWYIQQTAFDQETPLPSENGFLQVQITDTGRGIPPEDIGRLFGMFIQVHGTSIAYHGTGLGLWICKQLCNKMGGDIKVYSEVNKGTSFVFYIPVNNEKMNKNIGGGQFVNSSRDTVNVLIADDYAHNRELHKLLLEREGAKVTLATNGKEALQTYKEKGNGYYDLILMDVQMPEMDGFTAGKEIRAWEQENGWSKVHLYFVSGEYYNEDEVLASLRRSQGRSVDMTGVYSLRKPIDIQMVRGVLQKYKKYC